MVRDAMRVLHRDPKTGEIKVRVENADDLWHLHNLVLRGDLVRASTYRREEVKTDKVRPERGEKVRVTLTIRAESVEFQAFSDRLRITGVIVEGPQDLGRHHTLNVAIDDVLSLIKSWQPHELRRIEEAVAAAQKPLVAFLSLDDEDALLAQLRQYGVRELATIHAPGHGKMFPSGDTRFVYFDEILSKLRTTELGEALVLVGPGFTRDAFLEYLKAREPALASKIHSHGTAHAGMQGIQEALKAGVGAKVFGDSRVGVETRLVENLLEAIATNRPCAYGPAEVAEAIDAGAVETLLVSDAVVRNPGIEDLMRSAESARGAVVLVSRHHEAGQKLEALGGIAALLRFPIK
jgi:protein pelota